MYDRLAPRSDTGATWRQTMTTETAKVTIEQIAQIVGTTPDRIQLAGDEGDKWLRADQVGSRGIMNSWVTRLKEAGIPAFFRAADRTWGVLAERVQR